MVTIFLNSSHMLVPIIIYGISFSIKAQILLTKGLRSSRQHKAWLFLFLSLSCLMISDVSWATWLVIGRSHLTVTIARLAWAFYCIMYLSIFLLIESLLEKKYELRFLQKASIALTGILVAMFIYLACASIDDISTHILIVSTTYITLLLTTIFKALKGLRSIALPKILKKQIFILLSLFIVPFIIIDFLQDNFYSSFGPQVLLSSLSTTLITIAIYFCFKKIFELRFLNSKEHVHEEGNFDFIYDFKYVLAQLGSAMNEPEIVHATKSFFHKAFNISYLQTNLIVRDLEQSSLTEISPLESHVENFLSISKEQSDINQFLQSTKIFIYDEIAFTSFYEETPTRKAVLQFLDRINADIFLPIYDKKTIVAYITVERNARGKDLYTNVERDEMLVFASYLGNIIFLLQNKNLDAIVLKEHILEAELYHKHQEINQYKESIRSFLHSSREKKIGLIFYKNRKFIFGNQAAHEFVTFNLNTQEGHPLTKAFKNIARQVETYKSQQSCLSKDTNGNRIVIAGIPNLEKNNIVFTVYYPDVSDVIKEQVDAVRNPSEWDYVLYLETTQSGQLINKLIPGTGPTLLNFKISLLKAALNKKATLLDIPEEDLLDMAEILHHINLRHELHTIKLTSLTKNLDIAIKLFGINPIFDTHHRKALLEKLHTSGTLFIQNIHFLDLQTQHTLADYIKYGFYHPVKSDQRLYSDVRIICSTNQNLHALVQEGKFSEALYNELKTTVTMPSLLTLPESEFRELTHEYVEQTAQTQTFKNFLELTDREKNKLSEKRPVSLRDLRNRIQGLLVQKAKKKDVYHESYFNPAYNIADPELAEAAKLGKHALRDQRIMNMLWNKFKNQNKIATFLGVNRSSVNRRCKDFNLS